MLGAGAVRDGEAAYLSGTSEVGGIVSRRRVPTPGVIAFPDCEGITLHAGPTQAGGASVAWLAALLGRSADEISALAASSDPARPAPIFLPHLQGERAPLWDIAARASFSGLDASMGAPEIARAVLEGVAYSVRLLFGALESSSGVSRRGCVMPAAARVRTFGAKSAPTFWTGRSIGSRTSIPAWSAPPYWPERLRASLPPSKKLAPAWSGPSGRSSRTEP